MQPKLTSEILRDENDHMAKIKKLIWDGFGLRSDGIVALNKNTHQMSFIRCRKPGACAKILNFLLEIYKAVFSPKMRRKYQIITVMANLSVI